MDWLTNLLTNAEGEVVWWSIVLAIVIILIFAAIITGIIIFIVRLARKNKKDPDRKITKSKWTARELSFAAMCLALAFLLSFLRLWHMPQGGSITPASMLPIMLFAYIYGVPKGLIVGLAYGLLQCLQDFYVVHWAQFLLDYLIAFTVLGFAGLFKKSIFPGMAVSGLLRYAAHVISGVVFFSSYAAEAGKNALVYSLGYNSFTLIDLGICMLIALLTLISPIQKIIRKRQV